jgi:hypothetical protein
MLSEIHTAFASVMNTGTVRRPGAGDLGIGGGQSGHHKQDLLHHQSEPVSELLPQGESRAHAAAAGQQVLQARKLADGHQEQPVMAPP